MLRLKYEVSEYHKQKGFNQQQSEYTVSYEPFKQLAITAMVQTEAVKQATSC